MATILGINRQRTISVLFSSPAPFFGSDSYVNRTLGDSLKEENKTIAFTTIGSPKAFFALASNALIDGHFTGDSQCLPLYRYNSIGERHDNITLWALMHFRTHYNDEKISTTDIFHYVYAVLHHPAYRKKYELNLKRDFPRVPLYMNFRQWAKWGKALMDLHLNYEIVKPFALRRIETETNASKPKLKADKTSNVIIIDDATRLENVPPAAWEYKLGNRSALERILDQYKEKKPSDKTIAEKFNTYRFGDYKEHVINLLRRVATVSVKTLEIIGEMPD